MKKIKTITMFCTLIFSLLFSGCSEPVDLRDRAIVQAMAIDYENDEYKITLQEYMPQGGAKSADSAESSENIYVSSNGKTLFEALKNAEAKDGNRIFYGHSRVYIIGQRAAEQGLYQIVEFMDSNYQLSLNSAVMLAEGGAEDILHKRIFMGVVPDISVKHIEGCGKAPDAAVIDVLREVYNLDGTCCIPLISMDGKEEIKIENCAVFKDYMPHILLNAQETMGYGFVFGKISDAVMTAREGNQNISVNVVSDTTDIKLETENNKINLSVSVSAKGNISEVGVFQNEQISKQHINNVEAEIEKQIKEQIEMVFSRAVLQESCDLFYIKQRLKKTDKVLYNKLKDKPLSSWLPKIMLNVTVDFTVRHSGIQVR